MTYCKRKKIHILLLYSSLLLYLCKIIPSFFLAVLVYLDLERDFKDKQNNPYLLIILCIFNNLRLINRCSVIWDLYFLLQILHLIYKKCIFSFAQCFSILNTILADFIFYSYFFPTLCLINLWTSLKKCHFDLGGSFLSIMSLDFIFKHILKIFVF